MGLLILNKRRKYESKLGLEEVRNVTVRTNVCQRAMQETA